MSGLKWCQGTRATPSQRPHQRKGVVLENEMFKKSESHSHAMTDRTKLKQVGIRDDTSLVFFLFPKKPFSLGTLCICNANIRQRLREETAAERGFFKYSSF